MCYRISVDGFEVHQRLYNPIAIIYNQLKNSPKTDIPGGVFEEGVFLEPIILSCIQLYYHAYAFT